MRKPINNTTKNHKMKHPSTNHFHFAGEIFEKLLTIQESVYQKRFIEKKDMLLSKSNYLD